MSPSSSPLFCALKSRSFMSRICAENSLPSISATKFSLSLSSVTGYISRQTSVIHQPHFETQVKSFKTPIFSFIITSSVCLISLATKSLWMPSSQVKMRCPRLWTLFSEQILN